MRYVIGKPPPQPVRSARKGATVMLWGDDESVTANTAHVEDRPQMEDTGLVDAEGRKLYREREPFGFRPR